MDAQEALADLKQISVQIVHAVVADAAGGVAGSTLSDTVSAERLARSAQELWEAADGARRELGRDELAQLEVATPDGSVFLVRDSARMIIATTSADPTVGLVFYDLKACLRSIAEGAQGANGGAVAEAEPEPPAVAEPEPAPAPEPPAAPPEPAAAAGGPEIALEQSEPEEEADGGQA
jgi:predicted regulator of Ras-like GTPase activity (Roadblock/LC7/MglB family)